MIATAFALEITPNQVTVTTYQNETKIINLSITNILNYTIYNITFNSIQYIDFPIIPQLEPNQSIDYSFYIDTEGSFTSTTTTEAGFTYSKEITYTEQTHTINITSFGFIPKNLTARINDIIKIKNTHSIQHRVHIEDTDNTLQPNESIPFFYNSIRNVTYYDIDTGHTGFIKIINNTGMEQIHNEDYNVPFTITLNANYKKSDLVVEIFTNYFTLNYNEIAEGVLKLTAFNYTIHNLNLNATWINFNKNNFTMQPLESQILLFNVTPNITSTEQTNKSYLISLNIKADNLEPITEIIHLNINYHNFNETTTNQSNQTIVFIFNPDYVREYCEANPDDCPTIIITETETIYNQTTEAQRLEELKDELAKLTAEVRGDSTPDNSLKGQLQDLTIIFKDFKKWIEDDVEPVLKSINQTNEDQRQADASARRKKILGNVLWGVGFLLVAGGIAITIVILRQKQEEARRM